MTFSAAQVKELREKTGAGIMDAKKALVEHNGDMEKAMEYLRQKGIASADKKQNRIQKIFIRYICCIHTFSCFISIFCFSIILTVNIFRKSGFRPVPFCVSVPEKSTSATQMCFFQRNSPAASEIWLRQVK